MKRCTKLVPFCCFLLLVSAFVCFVTAKSVLTGDIDGDDDVDVDDARLVFDYISGIGYLSYDQLDLADVDGDGGVTVADAAQILHKADGTLSDIPFSPDGKGYYDLVSLPDKLEYNEGETIDLTGLAVGIRHFNGDIDIVDDYTYSGYDPTPGIKIITVECGDFRTSFSVTVYPAEIDRLEIVSLPVKNVYFVDEKLDLTGLVVKAVRSDGSSYVIENFTVDGYEPVAGRREITLKYRMKTVSFVIVVR